MQTRTLLIYLMLMVFSCDVAFAQDEAATGNDSTALPVIEYGSMPRKYEIADISISGADNYEDFVLIGYSGLAVGDVISVPGDEVTNATKRFWRQGLFSDVKIYADKIEGDKIWLHIALKQRPRISAINYHGLKKTEVDDLKPRLGLVEGSQITPNISDRAKTVIEKVMEEKGFKTTHDVHEYFVVRMADIVSAKGIKVGGWQESAMGHDEATDKFLRDKFAGINSWNTIPDWGDDSIPYSIANNGYKVILSNVGNFYLDMAYNANPEEPGLSWGGYVDEYRSWEGRPYDIYHSTSLTLDGKPLGADVAEGKPVLNEESKKNIIGIQAQMFGETIRNFGMVELYMFPKIFGVVERAWNATVDDEKMELIRYNRLIGTSELPYLQRCNINFHLGMPGIRRSDDMIFMNSPYPEAEIRYTTDGKEPDSGSKLWKGPVKASGKVIKAKLFYLGKESKTVELR